MTAAYSNDEVTRCVADARSTKWKRLKLHQVETKDSDLRALMTEPGIERLEDLFLEESPSTPLLSEKAVLALMAKCTDLKTLYVGWCAQLTDKGVDLLLRGCERLDKLSIVYGDRLSDDALHAIARHCHRLSSLTVSDYGPPFTDDGMLALAKIGEPLKTLSIEDCAEVTDKGLVALANGCGKLLSINLSRCHGTTDRGLAALAEHCPKLQILIAESCQQYTNRGFASLAEGCPDLRSLNLSGCKFVGDDTLDSLARNCPDLLSLRLSRCAITDRGMALLAQGCKKLESLELYSIASISDAGLVALLSGCRQLKSVEVVACERLTEAAFKAIGMQRRLLQLLNASGSEGITDAALGATAGACGDLQQLDISGCKEVTDDGIAAIADGCRGLKILNLMNCQRVTAKSLEALARNCSSLESLDLVDCRQIRDLSALASLLPDGGGKLKSLLTLRCTALYRKYGEDVISSCDPHRIYEAITNVRTKKRAPKEQGKVVAEPQPVSPASVDLFRERLRALIAKEKFAEQAEVLARVSEGYCILDTGDGLPGEPSLPGASRFGGLPDLPAEISWPELDGKKIPFLAQIHLATLPDWEGNPLPAEGYLFAFALMGHDRGSFESAVVLHYAGPRESLRQVMPEGPVWDDWRGQTIYEPVPLVGRLGWCIEGRRFLETMLEYRNDRHVLDFIPDALTMMAKAWDTPTPGRRLAGWLLGNISGIDGTTAQLARIWKLPGQGWVNLLAVSSVGTMSWSDSGTLYLMIKREHLERRDFSRVAMTWASA